MDNKHILLIGHPIKYEQFVDFLLKDNYRVTWVIEKEESDKVNPKLELVSLDILNQYEEAIKKIKEIHEINPFDAVVTHHEFYQIAKCKISEELSLVHHPVDSVIRANHKYFMKLCFRENNVPTASFTFFNLKSDISEEIQRIEAEFTYPLIVKPCNGMGSMGVFKVQNQVELKKALRVVRQIALNVRSSAYTSESDSYLIVEKYIDGDEFTVDGFVINGIWAPMISCDKYPPLTGPVFQENVYYFSPKEGKAIPDDLGKVAKQVVDALKIGDGPYHIEIRREFETGMCYVVEAAPRISGMGSTFYNLMYHSTGYNIYDLYIKQCLGEKVEIPNFVYENNTFEYDSYAKQGGAIREFKSMDKVLNHPLLAHGEVFKKIGDYIAPPGLNPETTAVFYFKTKSKEESVEIVNWIEENFEICTGG